ncbi:MAG: 3-dehydroquinate synthase [Bacteroidetes bacterium]|nr:3-dehydroquinate synthase [Bacteroidota bacterium]
MQQERLSTAGGLSEVFLGMDALIRFCAEISDAKFKILMLTDTNTAELCRPLVRDLLPPHFHLSIAEGEASKTLSQCEKIWEKLTSNAFERGDMIINLGGGMICDLGGFAASCYKRGIAFVHIPTTLLAMADAAIGGKTGIDFHGFKNQIGSFQQPKAVVIHPEFLETLPDLQLRAGYAEVLKHYLIHDADAWKTAVELQGLPSNWDETIAKAVKIKLFFTESDPTEKGIRKALNFGHTIGHAVESHFLQEFAGDPLLHGEAVAVGMACEAWISHQRNLISAKELSEIVQTLENLYGIVRIPPQIIPDVSKWCIQDKKNVGGRINATLLNGIGKFLIDQWLSIDEIEASLLAYHHQFSKKDRP